MGALGERTILHATTVAVDGRGLLILGPSGAGKSALGLCMMALGAQLVADDRTEVWREGAGLHARSPAEISGLIEARGIGILKAAPLDRAAIALVVDLGQVEPDRLPPQRRVTLLGTEVDLVLHTQSNHFPSALMLYLRCGRHA